jgi:diguanylate cyclase (GGDEF)-like protein
MPQTLPRRPVVVTGLVTLIAIVASVAITEATMYWLGYDAGAIPSLLAGFIPAVMVPVTIYPLATANQRLRQMREDLERIARTDALTGLPNRRAFFESAEDVFAVGTKRQLPVVAMMIDIDHFKAINDIHGHGAGDDILRSVAEIIEKAVRDHQPEALALARLGGEEFAVLTAGLDQDDATALAERIGEAVRHLSGRWKPPEPATAVSIGVAVRGRHDDIDAVLTAADSAVYRAKHAGRDRWSFALPASPAPLKLVSG